MMPVMVWKKSHLSLAIEVGTKKMLLLQFGMKVAAKRNMFLDYGKVYAHISYYYQNY